MDEKRIDQFEQIEAKLEGVYSEISLLSKKKPDDALNKFKLKYINDIVVKANGLLGKEYRPFTKFETFDENDVPTSSDVVLILSQYLQAFDMFRQHNTELDYGIFYWKIGGEKSDRQAKQPKYFKT